MKRRSVFFAIAALAALALPAPVTHAASVSVLSDSGTVGGYTLSNIGGALELSFSSASGPSQLQTVNRAPVSGVVGTSFSSPIPITVLSSSGSTFSISVPTESKTFTEAGAVSTVFYDLTSAVEVTVSLPGAPPQHFLNLSGPITGETQTGTPATYDFSGDSNGGVHNLTLTASSLGFSGASSFAGVFSAPGFSIIGSFAGFSQTGPEPTSMALLGIALSGLITFRRFFKWARVT